MPLYIELSAGNFSTIGGSGAIDRREAGDAYGAALHFSASGGERVYPYWGSLMALVESGDDDSFCGSLGVSIASSDAVYVPLVTSHGPNLPGNEGQFGIVFHWDESANKLITYIYCQGLEGTGDGSRTKIPATALSFDQIDSASTGMRIPLPFSKFLFAYENSWTDEHGSSGITIVADSTGVGSSGFANPAET